MSYKFLTQIRKRAFLWNAIKETYWTFKSVESLLLGDYLNQRKWASLNNAARIKQSWESRKAPHRRLILDALTKCGPFKSVLEIGCDCGPNLYNLATSYPNIVFRGMDINAETIRQGRTYISQGNCSNIDLVEGDLNDLKSIPSQSYDIVFTDAVLLYTGPLRFKQIIAEIFRITKQKTIFIEWHQQRTNNYIRTSFYKGFWVRDYAFFCHNLGISNLVIDKIPKGLWQADGWEKFGCVIQVDMERTNGKMAV